MADTVTSTTILDGRREVIIQLTNESDGTGESAVTKVDVSALSPPATSLEIEGIWYSTQGMSVELHWDATTDVLAWVLPADQTDCLDFAYFGGIQNNAGAGVTGDLNLTTVGHTSGDTYNIVLKLKKNY